MENKLLGSVWRTVYGLSLLTLVASKAFAAAAPELPNQPLSLLSPQYNKTLSSGGLSLPAVNIQQKRAQFASSHNSPGPVTFAQPFDYSIDPLSAPGWSEVIYQNTQIAVWRYQLNSPDALSLNLGFTRYFMPAGGHLFIYDEKHQQITGPWGSQDNAEHGELWTPIVNGRSLVIEINIAADSKQQLDLRLTKINQAFLNFSKLSADVATLKSGSCNVDVACPVSTGWEDQIRSVAAYTLSGSTTCSGAAINSTANGPGNTSKAYFLTAFHCEVRESNDQTVVAYWNYQNSTCRTPGSASSGAPGDGSLAQFNSGTIYRAGSQGSDFTLLEFDEPILAAANVYLAGWSRSESPASSAVGIHHPQVEEKRISFEDDPLTVSTSTINVGSESYAPGTLLIVDDWDLGTTEGGSSGSPLFDPNKRIVGQLLGGFAACGNNSSDFYGRFASSWNDSPASADLNLKSWLDASQTNAMVLDGQNYVFAPNLPPPATDDDFILQIIPAIISASKNLKK